MNILNLAKRTHLIRPLEGYRALAILAVLFFHLDMPYFQGGYIGVDLFFVISGFIITKNIHSNWTSGKFSFGTFYIKRIRRLFPALFLTILLTLLAGFFILTPGDYTSLSVSALYSTFSLANIHFWLSTNYFDTAAGSKPLLHMWSLSVEEQFYIIWPAVLVGLLAFKARSRLFMSGVIFALFTLSAIGAVWMSIHSPPTAFFWFVFRIYQFMAGAILVFILVALNKTVDTRIQKSILPIVLNVIALICIIVACYVFDKSTNAALAGLLTAIIGICLLASMETRFAETVFGNPIAVWIGQHSYSLYLVHWPIIVFYKYRTGDTLSIYDMVILGAASVIAAVMLRFLVEQPFRIKSEPKKNFEYIYSSITIIFFAGVIIAAPTILSKKGFPDRFDAELASLLNEKYDLKAHQAANRVGDCFLDRGHTLEDLKPFCYESVSTKKSVLIIGSSLAADFYPGLAKNMPDWSVYQVTASGCPPFYAFEVKEPCAGLRRFVYQELLESQKYDLVLLSGFNSKVSDQAIAIVDNYMVERSINYAILGPRPSFTDRPTVLIKNYGEAEGLEAYMQSNLNGSEEIKYPFAVENYYSLNQSLCDENDNCRWYGNGSLYYKDLIHFSVDGSNYVTQDLASWIRDVHG